MKNLYPRIQLVSILAAACLALAPAALAVDPPPDGGYANDNTAEGTDALFSLTSGGFNTAIGKSALFREVAGSFHTAVGWHALYYENGNAYDTAVGYGALENTFGGGNTAVGALALQSDYNGGSNTAVGNEALYMNTSAYYNVAIGSTSMLYNTTGTNNTAIGTSALAYNSTSSNNTAVGISSLQNSTGESNTAIGANALFNNSTGRNNVALGYNAGRNLTMGSGNIDIGSAGGPGESNTIRIGKIGTQTNTLIAGISGVTVAGGVGVVIDTTGHLGTVTSSQRFKDQIKSMDRASEAILALKPVTFRYKKELDPVGVPQFGLVAEQVEKVNPDLVARDDQGKPYTVRYEAVNAMLLNEFLKEHHEVLEQAGKIEQLEATVTQLKSMMALQTALIQKVSAQFVATQPKPQLVTDE